MRTKKIFAGARLRNLRQAEGLTQGEFATRLDVSTSYVNQMENNQRPLSAAIILGLVENFNLDIASLAGDESDRILADLREVFVDPIFQGNVPPLQDIKIAASNTPIIAHALLELYQAYKRSNERLASLDDVLLQSGGGSASLPYEEVRDFFHYADNYIDRLDQAAEVLAEKLALNGQQGIEQLQSYLKTSLGIEVKYLQNSDDDQLLRYYSHEEKILYLDSTLARSTQLFELAHQIALLQQVNLIERILDEAAFKTKEARAIGRIGLANYFAGALVLPYGRFLQAAKSHRHDLERLSSHFGASLEQVAHRLSTMQRPGQKGVPFFFARIDQAGTITKRHSATPLQFARFGGACPLWNVYRAFEGGEQIDRQMAETPDGVRYICLARKIIKRGAGYGAKERRYAIALGCEVKYASSLIYADHLDLKRDDAYDPIGISCRICERQNCHQRSVPPMHGMIEVDPNKRRIVPFKVN